MSFRFIAPAPPWHGGPLGEIIENINRFTLIPNHTSPRITDVQYAASFNWVGAVDISRSSSPGEAPRWNPSDTSPTKLSEITGQYFRDVNAAHSPSYALNRTVSSLAAKVELPHRSIHLVACESTLNSLLCFVRGESETFRFRVESVYPTVFLNPCTHAPRELKSDADAVADKIRQIYTTWPSDYDESTSNQRLIRYKLGHVSCVMRYDCHGYLTESQINPEIDKMNPEVMKRRLGLLPDISTPPPEQGDNTPQSATFRMASLPATQNYGDLVEKNLCRLWLTQTPNLVIGYHTGNDIISLGIERVTESVRKWTRDNDVLVAMLAGLLERIMDRAHLERHAGPLETCRYDQGPLEVRRGGPHFSWALDEYSRQSWAYLTSAPQHASYQPPQ